MCRKNLFASDIVYTLSCTIPRIVHFHCCAQFLFPCCFLFICIKPFNSSQLAAKISQSHTWSARYCHLLPRNLWWGCTAVTSSLSRSNRPSMGTIYDNIIVIYWQAVGGLGKTDPIHHYLRPCASANLGFILPYLVGKIWWVDFFFGHFFFFPLLALTKLLSSPIFPFGSVWCCCLFLVKLAKSWSWCWHEGFGPECQYSLSSCQSAWVGCGLSDYDIFICLSPNSLVASISQSFVTRALVATCNRIWGTSHPVSRV